MKKIKNRNQRSKAKREVAEIILEEIENHTQGEVSPVTGEAFPKLKTARQKQKQGYGKDADLHRTGKMIDAIKVDFKENGLELKITDKLNKAKAMGHNSGFKGHKSIPNGKKYKREFLPDDTKKSGKSSNFNKNIQKRIAEALEDYKDGD